MQQKPACLFGVSVVITVCGLVLTFIWPAILKYILQNKFVLTPDSEIFGPWKRTPFSIPLDVYLFNWTNPNDVYNSTVKPKFQQVGPYRYWEDFQKSNITWNANGTVSFRHLKYWYFDEAKDNGDLQGRINIINPVLITAAHTVRSWNYIIRKATLYTLASTSSRIYINRTIDEMLFKGAPDPLISLSILAGKIPPVDKFGFFYMRNGSIYNDGIFNMGTGINSIFGQLYSWNYMSENSYYGSNCGKIDGSPGGFFPLYENKSSISLFIPNLCRSVKLRLVGETEVENIPGYKYALETYALDNGTLFPENRCFCNGECVPSGVFNISSCSYDAPFFASLPHFYNADPYYTNLVEGLEPEQQKHEFYITLEPTTNLVLEAEAKVQLNMMIQPIEGISFFEKLPKAFFPLMWSRHHAKIPTETAYNLRILVAMRVVFPAIGITITVLGLSFMSCIIYKQCVRRKEDDILYSEQSIPFKTEN